MMAILFVPTTPLEGLMAQNGREETIYLTRERLVQLEQELHDLKVNGRRTMAQKIADARGHGDLSENAEYDAAKEEQEHLEMRIGKLEQTLARAKLIDARDLPNDKVYILSRVRIRDLKTNDEFEYLLVSPEEADYDLNKISVTSPIGKSLLGKTKGERLEIKVPAGMLAYEILDINR
jgi:transcription elongation factor GreA